MTAPTCYYSIVRYLPDVARGEFLNVGMILVCPERQFVHAKTLTRRSQYSALPDADPGLAGHMLDEIQRNLDDAQSAEPFELLGINLPSNRVVSRDLLDHLHGQYRNSIRFSPAQSAAGEPQVLFATLYSRLVAPKCRRSRDGISREISTGRLKKNFKQRLEEASLLGDNKVSMDMPITLSGSTKFEVDFGYKNGALHCLQFILFSDHGKNGINRAFAYRMLNRDLRDAANVPSLRNARLTALMQVNEADLRTRGYIDMMKSDGIEPVDYNELDNVLLDIRRNLTTGSPALFS